MIQFEFALSICIVHRLIKIHRLSPILSELHYPQHPTRSFSTLKMPDYSKRAANQTRQINRGLDRVAKSGIKNRTKTRYLNNITTTSPPSMN